MINLKNLSARETLGQWPHPCLQGSWTLVVKTLHKRPKK